MGKLQEEKSAVSNPQSPYKFSVSSIPIDAAPAQNAQMEPRIAKLEAHAEHFDKDLREVKQELRQLNARLDKGFLILASLNIGSTLALAGLIAKSSHWI